MEIKNLAEEPLKKVSKNNYWPLIAGALVVVVAGVGLAWFLSARLMGRSLGSNSNVAPGAKVTSTEAGVLDPKVKYDTATGMLVAGGLGNEGIDHLDRDGTALHMVYLTSSVVDLSSFIGKKVQVWGQTLASKKAPWLMDVSKVQITQ